MRRRGPVGRGLRVRLLGRRVLRKIEARARSCGYAVMGGLRVLGRSKVFCGLATHAEAKKYTSGFLDYASFTVVIRYDTILTLATLFVLFAPNLQQIWAPVSSDPWFTGLYSACLAIFAVDLVLSTWSKTVITVQESKKSRERKEGKQGTRTRTKINSNSAALRTERLNSSMAMASALDKKQSKNEKQRKGKLFFKRVLIQGYMLTFYFWLDVLSILSIVPEVPWLVDLLGMDELSNDRESQIWRVLRMVRLVRLVQLYKLANFRNRRHKIFQELDHLMQQGLLDEEEAMEKVGMSKVLNKKSKVGDELSDTIIRRVILGVFLMLCVVPLLTWTDTNREEQYSTEYLHRYNVRGDPEMLDFATNQFLETMGSSSDGAQRLISLKMQPGDRVIVDSPGEDFRPYELREQLVISEGGFSTEASFSHRGFLIRISYYNLLLTVFQILMLALGIHVFNRDAQRLVLTPIERMMDFIEYMAVDPLNEELDLIALAGEDCETGEYEMRLLETAITKITGLLRVGFGEAGAEIIANNLRVDDSASSVLDPMIPGKRVYCIFGFCDIHNFEAITEGLHGEVMTFVNTVAAVVHASTSAFAGQCNKNLGNSFLIVWRIGDAQQVQQMTQLARIDVNRRSRLEGMKRPQSTSDMQPKQEKAQHRRSNNKMHGGRVDLKRVPGVDVLADKALIAFLKVIYEVNLDKACLAYGRHPGLNRMHQFKISMGFGLHTGWAIEGAVGSIEKVDATYLSPHVNMCARMETASRQYGMPLLMTYDFYQLLSPEGQKKCRKLDVIKVKGSNVPMPVFTYDTHINQVLKPRNMRHVMGLEDMLEEESESYTPAIWNEDPQLTLLRNLCTEEFDTAFAEGVEAYLLGDPPSKTLLEYMGELGFTPPEDWKGARQLSAK